MDIKEIKRVLEWINPEDFSTRETEALTAVLALLDRIEVGKIEDIIMLQSDLVVEKINHLATAIVSFLTGGKERE